METFVESALGLYNVRSVFLSSVPFVIYPSSTSRCSPSEQKLALTALHQYAGACSPCHRISINPSTATSAQITGQNLRAKLDFRRSVITYGAANPVSFPVTSTNVGCYKRRDGHDTLFGYEIDAFHRSLLQSPAHRVVYWQ